MANLTEQNQYEDGIYQIEKSDPVVGGADGISNRQANQLANRTHWLKARLDGLLDGSRIATLAARLATPRKINGVAFDGSADITIEDASKAPLDSPAFTNKPTAPTAPRFDISKQLVNTEALKARGLEFAIIKDITAAGTVVPSDAIGGVVRVNLVTSGAVILPTLADLPVAAALLIKNVSASSIVTVTPAGTDTLPQPLTLPPLCSALLVARPSATAWLVTGGAAEALAAVGSNVIGQLGLRNRLINPSFYYWQRGFTRSLSNTPNAVYCSDRFLCYTGSGGACTVTRNVHATGAQLGQTYLSWQQTTAASNNAQLSQRLESVRTLEGRKTTFSLVAATVSAVLSCQVVFRQYFGTGGSPSAPLDTVVGSFSTDGNNGYSRKIVTFDAPSISGKTIGTNGDDFAEVLVVFPSGMTFVFNTWDWQLEEGALATPFEARPPALELSLCQRYCETGYYLLEGYCTSGGGAGISYWCEFKVPKRATPTITLSAMAGVNMGAHAVQGTSVIGFQPRATANSSAQSYISGNYLAEAEL